MGESALGERLTCKGIAQLGSGGSRDKKEENASDKEDGGNVLPSWSAGLHGWSGWGPGPPPATALSEQAAAAEPVPPS